MFLIRIDIVSSRMTHVVERAVKWKVIKDMNERINEPLATIYEDVVVNEVVLPLR